MQNTVSPWIYAARPKTLPAALAPVLLGSAFAYQASGFCWLPAVICLVFALLIQIGTNYANDYFDFVQGADTPNRMGPARMVASGKITPTLMRRGMLLVFAGAFVVGLFLIPYGGWVLLPLGVLCILCGIGYTGGPFPLAYRGLGEIFVFLFFGVVAVCATFYVLTGTLTVEVLLGSMVCGALATNILLVNNYRDVEEDRRANKRTLTVRYGRAFTLVLFQAMILIALFMPLVLWMRGMSPEVLLPLLAWPLTFWLRVGLVSARTRKAFDRTLAFTAIYLLLYVGLLSLGIGTSTLAE